MSTNEILVIIVSFILIVLGGIGSILPILPGVPLSYAGLFLYAWYTDFEQVGSTALVIFGILTLLTIVLDFIGPGLGAKRYKASKYGVIGSMIGAFAGIFILGPLGLLLGPFIGGFIGEYYSGGDINAAGKAAWGSFVGFAVGSLLKVVIAVAMLAYFVYALF
ncbi:MAG TPA: DUF456 domain-containing protein [Candidatus Binatia bacterium]|nr:DUF456 domain-containing protein [Candidatus Binatia bacterium]